VTLLALDTATELGSVAVGPAGGPASARRFLLERMSHAASILPAVREVLDGAGVSLSAVEGVVVGAGPGSFTGVRVAAATAKGLVHALGVPLFAVSSLAAAAVTAELELEELDTPVLEGDDRRRPRYVLFDARGERVYAACYRVGEGRLDSLVPPHASRVGAVLDEGPETGSFFCGAGARRHRKRIAEGGYRVLPAPAGSPTADALLRVMGLEPEPQPVGDPGRWEPEYVREWRSGRERKAG